MMDEDHGFQGWLRGLEVLVINPSPLEVIIHQLWLNGAGAVVHAAKCWEEGIASVAMYAPRLDVVVLGEGTIRSSSLGRVEHLRVRVPCSGLLVYADVDDPHKLAMIRGRGAALLSRSATEADFVLAVAGRANPKFPSVEAVVAEGRRKWSLSPEQTRLFYYNLQSYSNHEIAACLGVSLDAVQERQQNLLRKTGALSVEGCFRLLMEPNRFQHALRDA